jgi:hypothetical protein
MVLFYHFPKRTKKFFFDYCFQDIGAFKEKSPINTIAMPLGMALAVLSAMALAVLSAMSLAVPPIMPPAVPLIMPIWGEG